RDAVALRDWARRKLANHLRARWPTVRARGGRRVVVCVGAAGAANEMTTGLRPTQPTALATAAVCACLLASVAHAQEWSGPVRGGWVRVDDRAQQGDLTLAQNGNGCEIVVAADEHSAVARAAAFLATDIERISGYKPPIVSTPSGRRVSIRLSTLAGTH